MINDLVNNFVFYSLAALILTVLFYRLNVMEPTSCVEDLSPDSRVLLAIAHPDDEVMFFSPLIANLLQAGIPVSILSVTSPMENGVSRVLELQNSLRALGILGEEEVVSIVSSLDDVSPFSTARPSFLSLNLTAFENGDDWNASDLSSVFEKFLDDSPLRIYTFDYYGVSGHVNHKALSSALSALSLKHEPVELRQLYSVNRLWKYVGPLSWSLKQLWPWRLASSTCYAKTPIRVFLSFWSHRSQHTWYRWLYVMFSRYMYMNSFV